MPPAVLIPCYHRFDCPESRILEALYTSAGIGQVIAYRASIAGASGGCQAEIGSASSMAAGALVQLRGGTPEQIADAAAIPDEREGIQKCAHVISLWPVT